ncbi:MAG: GtrA family protein [Clostridia bacterium]|nr:GtrA family protein [Clostridia bacterium]
MYIRTILKKYKPIVLYVFFGGLTTLVNIISYFFTSHVLNCNTLISNSVAWMLSVLFAFITNKLYVFNSQGRSAKELIYEIVSFFSCRVFSGVIDTAIMVLLVDFLQFNSMACKIITNVIVMTLNYFASKFVIFKK